VHLGVLNEEGVYWVTRSKESLCLRVLKRLLKGTDKRILSDELVVLKNKDSRANYPEAMRRVRALVEVAVGGFGRFDQDKPWQETVQVQTHMKLGGGFAPPVLRPVDARWRLVRWC
jgi:hypothetical protein